MQSPPVETGDNSLVLKCVFPLLPPHMVGARPGIPDATEAEKEGQKFRARLGIGMNSAWAA